MTREELTVKNGFEYDVYFPKALGGSITKKKGATVEDTIRFIPTVVQETQWQTKRFANEVVKGDTLYQTCKNIWEFVFNHIAYKKDEDGKEQVRSPARTWRDRHNFDTQGNTSGVDCDCYSVFISSILSNLKIKHVLRITKYGEDHFQHIYPIVPTGNGKYITIDCVVKQFNYEEPYTEKQDTAMDLEYLNGVTVSDRGNNKNTDTQDLMGLMGEREAMMELGKVFKRKTSEQKHQRNAKIKKFINKGLHVTNRVNPATTALRVGILAAMKLNFMKIASELKYTYLSDDEARRRNLPMDKFPKMKRIREKLEKLFYGAGGKLENLKKAILTGKGNKNKDVPVNGLGYISYENVDGLHEDLNVSQLLGSDMINSEGVHEVNGMGALGEPATAAAIAAASTVLTTIFAMIKTVGSLIPKKKADGKNGDGSGSDNASDNNSSNDNSSSGGDSTPPATETTSTSNDSNPSGSADTGANTTTSNNSTTTDNNSVNSSPTTNMPATTDANKSESKTEDASTNDDAGNTENTPSTQRNANAKDAIATSTATKVSFWEKNKKWIKPTGIAVGSLGLIALAYQVFKPKAQPKLAVAKTNLNGVKSNKPKSKKGGHTHKPSSKKKSHPVSKKKEAVTLM